VAEHLCKSERRGAAAASGRTASSLIRRATCPLRRETRPPRQVALLRTLRARRHDSRHDSAIDELQKGWPPRSEHSQFEVAASVANEREPVTSAEPRTPTWTPTPATRSESTIEIIPPRLAHVERCDSRDVYGSIQSSSATSVRLLCVRRSATGGVPPVARRGSSNKDPLRLQTRQVNNRTSQLLGMWKYGSLAKDLKPSIDELDVSRFHATLYEASK
jgi:hypothetical protein